MFSRLILSLLFSAAIMQPIGARADSTITPDEQKKVIETFSTSFKQKYVFPDLAQKTADMLQQHLANHDYDSVTDGAAFGKMLTDQVHDVCHDAHIHFKFSAEALPERKRQEQPTPEEIKRQKDQMKAINGGYEHVDRLSGNIGYLEVRSFEDVEAAKAPLEGAMEFLQNTDALILDLRRNGGGDPAAVAMLLSYFFDHPTHLNDFVDGSGKLQGTSWTNAHVHGAKYLKPVYVLVSKRTGSGAEECAYDIQSLKRGPVIGTSTWGGANPGTFYRLDDHYLAFIPSLQARNPYTLKNWEGTGVEPDVKVDGDAQHSAYEMALKDLLAKSSDAAQKQRLEMALKEIASN
jgi:C-terminal processing protease CtpA/Prc